ncbi:hypothetical protein [Streptomyces sp. NPDC049813]|uniref:hypothetical protein n=1 Tax=Streptomyces sp. NPDC049813 TaxID=3365597 RepID=UPI003787EBE8
MKRGLKLTAVAAMVVLALTGFSTGRGHSRGHSGSGGGGCSSSSQNHGGSSNSSTSGGGYGSSGSSGSSGSTGSTYDDDDDDRYGSGTTGGSSYNRRRGYRSTPTSSASGRGRTAQDGVARLVACADVSRPYATVEVRNPNAERLRFAAHITFTDASGATVKDVYHEVKAGAKEKVTVKVPVGSADRAARVAHCAVDRDAPAV